MSSVEGFTIPKTRALGLRPLGYYIARDTVIPHDIVHARSKHIVLSYLCTHPACSSKANPTNGSITGLSCQGRHGCMFLSVLGELLTILVSVIPLVEACPARAQKEKHALGQRFVLLWERVVREMEMLHSNLKVSTVPV